jgi:hypothetical protein
MTAATALRPTTTTRRTSRTPKAPAAPWKPRVQIVDLDAGVLLAQSQSDPAKSYICNGRTGACNCPSAVNRPEQLCKHGRIAQAAWPHLLDVRARARAQQQPIPINTHRGSAAGLLEAFGCDL